MKKKLTIKQKAWWIGIHIVFVAAWLGSSFVLLMLSITALCSRDDMLLVAIPKIMRSIDLFVIIPAAIGILITGLFLSILSHWGIKKYYWIVVKEAATIFLIVLGAIWLSPLVLKAVQMTSTQGIGVLSNPEYLWIHKKILFTSIIVLPLLIGMVIISKLKPWGSIQHKHNR